MKVFTVAQVRAWDQFTIARQPISSLDLMERASVAFVDWFCAHFDNQKQIVVFCGMGNNGGDGLAIGRLLVQKEYTLKIYVVKHTDSSSPDFEANLQRLPPHTLVSFVENATDIPALTPTDLVLDALLGSGLSRPATGIMAQTIAAINQSSATVVAVDIASGLFADTPNGADEAIVRPHFTVSFQCPKLAFFQPQNADFVGDWHCIDIGLHPDFEEQTPTLYFYTDAARVALLLKPRPKYAHKGTFGHALIIAGSYGKIGAAVLSARACLRSGVGLLTVQTARCGYEIVQVTLPEAMIWEENNYRINTKIPDYLGIYSAIGIGPGLGKAPETLQMLRDLLELWRKPAVFDADALNLLAENPELLSQLPPNSILTPHPKEFQRLLGKTWANDYEKLHFLRNFAQQYQVVVCLKGAHTAVALTNGTVHFNATGNAGMATGGSGDALTGIVTALLAQGYDAADAAVFGVYQHGHAGDRAAAQKGQSALIASDIINCLGW